MIKRVLAVLFFPFFVNGQSAFIAGNDTICANALDSAKVSISFTGVSPFTFAYSKSGEVQGSVTTTVNPHIIWAKEEGYYSLISFSDINSIGDISGEALVTVLDPPVADFITQPDSMTILYPTTQCIDRSIGDIVSWRWDFGDNTITDYSQNPYHTYADSIWMWSPTLIVEDAFGCSDTVTKFVTITDEFWIYIPNSFTPDNDGVNDKFCIQYNGVRMKTFSLNVFDRFSNLVYTTQKIEELECLLNSNGWDGTHYETGNDLPMGTYIYEIYFQDFEGWKHQEMGHIFLIR